MTRLSYREKEEIKAIFKRDLDAVQDAMNSTLASYWNAVKETIVEEVGIKDRVDAVSDLEKKIEDKKAELQRMREQMMHEISSMERELIGLRNSAVGEYSGPPTIEQLKDLNVFDHDQSVEQRRWYGFPIRTKLDAAVALRLRDSADISKPIKALEGVARSVANEIAFASTHEAAYGAYKKFHDLGFREMGVNLPPLLEDIKGLQGDRLLAASLIEETRRLSDGKEGQKNGKKSRR